MSDEELLKRFKEWKDGVGRAAALSYLTAREISPTTADLLTRDEYTLRPRKKLRAVLTKLVQAS